MEPIAFIDESPILHKSYIVGLQVLNPSKLEKLIKREKVHEVLIAMPSASKST